MSETIPAVNVEDEVVVPAPPSFAMFRTLAVIAMLSGLFVVLIVQWANPYIAANKKAATEAAVFNVVPGASISKTFILEGDKLAVAPEGATGTLVYAGYDNAGSLIGMAIPGVATGYAGPVYVMFGYSPAKEAVIKYQILTMTETPGLGDKVVTDQKFLANFDNLVAKLNDAGTALANAIKTVPNKSKQHPWEIDAISGATITSTAVGNAINSSAQQLLPVIVKQLPLIREQGIKAEGAK
ncbi:FMN-binding protein [Sansalvadorimonas sp. 2012CJ34-2]|uniref:Ion-translocating oxidoreductase complex subunit G n=1 Tax=Parendozoicomonas callyspongiae TaxID=2942213 RepID=A0ABT0PFM3_9GAMM|nr:FMN-binding protein [Sansalvadorimonas sp. 2012CJ34-2]MCL6270143.1 FMN-binding protein [Sansalvadorimonas sp. 2012CJ34-2]